MHILDTDIWQEILDSLSRHKLRTLLTAFGVFWGIFMLVNLIGMGKGLENGMHSGFGSNTNTIFFWSGHPTTIPFKGMSIGRKIRITESDINIIKQRFPKVGVIAGGNGAGNLLIEREANSEAFEVQGVSPYEDDVSGYQTLTGRFINALDIENKRKTVVIGEGVKDVLFIPEENPIGKRINIAGTPFLVVGVFAPKGTGDFSQSKRDIVLLPRSTLKKIFNQGTEVHWMSVIPKKGFRSEEVQVQLIDFLLKKNKVHPDDSTVIGSFNLQKEFDRWQGLFSAIAIFSWTIAIGTIIAGVIGVSNIMLIIVKERTQEIGLRKALGATPRNIITMIVQEAMVLTFVAGYFGLVVGVWAIEGVAEIAAKAGPNSTFSNPEVEFSTAISALFVLLLAGLMAALLPAKRAASIEPVVALQDE